MKIWTLKPLLSDCILYVSFHLFIFIMMNLLAWNYRGVGNRRFPALINDCIRMYNICFLALLEPCISGQCAEDVIRRLGFDGVARVDAVGFSGGIWCLWKQNRVSMDVISTS